MIDWDFQTPELLLLLPLAIAVGIWHWRHRRPALNFPGAAALTDLPRGRAPMTRWISAWVRGGIVASLIVAASNPSGPDLQTRLPVEGIAIVFALDVSGSMATPDFVPVTDAEPISRLTAAQRAFRLFLSGGTSPDGLIFPGRSNDQVGLVTFASIPVTVCPLTLNHSVLLKILDNQKPQDALTAGTNIGDAVGEALLRLESVGVGRKKIIVLLSDGEHNKSDAQTLRPAQSAILAAKLQIPVYTIDCGGDPVGDDPESGKQRSEGRAAMERLAETTSGHCFIANSGTDLRAALRDIDRLERSPVESFRYRRYFEYGPAFGMAALGLLTLLILFERTRGRIVPQGRI